MKHPILTTTVAVLLTLPAASHAENGQLPETVVNAKKNSITAPPVEVLREEIQRTPGGVTLIDSENYKKGRVNTLKDALDFAPGVFVQPRFGADEARLSIRGSGIQRTFHGRGLKLLQDGVPLNLADGSFDFQAVEPLAARAVEVYRGANALEFGGTTLGGAINFISPTGYDAPRLTLRGEFGSFGTWRGQIASGGVQGAFDWYASFSHASQDGFRDHSRQSTQRLFANFGYKLSDTLETRFYVTYVNSESELPGNLTKTQLQNTPWLAQRNAFVKIFDNVDSDWQRNYDLFRLANKTTWQEGDHRLSLSTFWSYKDLDHPILFVIDQLSNDFGVNLRYDYSGDLAGHKNRFTLGFMPTWGIVEDNRYANVLGRRGAKIADSHQTSLNLDFYAQNEFWMNDRLALMLGGQVSYARRRNRDDFPTGPDNSDTQDWWGFSPKIGLLYQPQKDLQIFANVSRSFEPPSFGELTDAANNGRGLVKLNAQTGTTIEIGTRGRSGRIGWDFAYYYSWLDNELLEYQVAPGLTQTVNAGRTTHQGIEVGLDVDVARGIFSHGATEIKPRDGKGAAPAEPGSDRIVLRTAYLWNDFRYDGDRNFGNGLLAGTPEHYLRAELMYEHPCGFYAGPNVEYVPKGYRVDARGTLFTDSYALLGAKIGWRGKRGVAVFFEAKNLTDEHYAATTGVVSSITPFNGAQFLPGDGRGFYGGVEFRW
ncbi:MAG: TonB-dependent receptor [Verrucomicrobia bacterium]|nr:TonB-dependent receptor [Verrucomicrobiota bacterium]